MSNRKRKKTLGDDITTLTVNRTTAVRVRELGISGESVDSILNKLLDSTNTKIRRVVMT